MEDRDEETGITKHKMEEKRKFEDDDSQDYITKKKKKKTTDKEEEKDNDKVHGKRKKRDKENHCKEKYRSGAKKKQKECVNTSPTTKRKKKERKFEKNIKEFTVTEASRSRKKKKIKEKKKKKNKKKKKREEREGNTSLDSSFTEIPPVTENKREENREEEVYEKGERREGKRNKRGEENHITENRGEKMLYRNQEIIRREEIETEWQNTDSKDGWRKRRASKEITEKNKNGEDEMEKRGKVIHPNQGRSDEDENQNRNTSKQMAKANPRSNSLHPAYRGSCGWETDASTDDLDFSDDQYHLPPASVRSRVLEARRRRTTQYNVIYTEGDEVEGVESNPEYFSQSDDECFSVEVPPSERPSPGFVLKARHIPTLEEAIYRFPQGYDVPSDDVDDSENYWILKERVLQVASHAEEAKEYIDGKIKYMEDYFERLECGELDASELKEKRPENFDEPYYPTPHQLKFLDTLNIRVNWQLSDLHKHHLETLTYPSRSQAQWNTLRLFANTTRFSPTEDRIIARNWFAFTKEYGFYDLRPLLSVRTARLVWEDGQMKVQPFEYVSHTNRVHFLLYLAKDLPTRTLGHINRRILKLLPLLHGRCLLRQSRGVSGRLLAQLLYVMELFGVDMVAAELLVGHSLRSYFNCCFKTHIMLRDIKLRVGPWRREEDARFLSGLQEVLGVRSFREAYRLRRIPWLVIFPYVRTRGIMYMRRRLIVLASEEGEKEQQAATKCLMAKFIKLVCQQQVDDFTQLDWEELARQAGAANPIRLVWSFRKLYYNHIPLRHKNTVPDGLRYMQEHILPFYEEYMNRRIPQPGDPDYQEPQHTHHPNLPSPNPSDDPDIDTPTCDTELSHPTSAARSPSLDSTYASSRVVNKAVGSDYSKGRTTPGDLKHIANEDNGRVGGSSQDHHPRSIKKVNSNPIFNTSRPRKVTSSPSDHRYWKNPNSHQEYLNENPNPSSLAHDHCIDDPEASVLSDPFYPGMSDDEDDDELLTSSDSDADDFELETLSQAVQGSVSHGKRK